VPHILLSYRREDSAAYAGRLADRLREHFAPEQVFMDIDTIKLGEDFVQAIEASVQSCDVVIAVIGRNWATAADASGRRRLARADDFVRLEIATALRRNIRVVPALVGGAVLPEAQDLPDDLAPLARRQSLEISDGRFHHDVDRLIQALSEVRGAASDDRAGAPTTGRNPEAGSKWRPSGRSMAVAAAALLALLAGIYWAPDLWRRITGRPSLTVEEAQFDPRSAQQPQPLALDTIHKISLTRNQEMYFQLASPSRDFRVVLDARCGTDFPCSMNTELSILDPAGAVIKSGAIRVITHDVAYRRMSAVSLASAGRIRLKLLNQSNDTVDFWLTAAEPDTFTAVPYFGTVAPGRLEVGEDAAGGLAPGAAAAYAVRLTPGKYTATLDLSVAPRDAESLSGMVGVLDTADGDESTPVSIIHYGVSARASGVLSIPAEQIYLFRVQNKQDSAVNFIFTLTKG
jgi:hypothetical protein